MRLASERRTTSASIRSRRPSGLSPAASSAGLPDLDPGSDEVLRLRRRPIGHRLHAAALPVPHHHEARNLEHPDAEFERRARAVMTGVGAVARHQRRDIAHHEQFARHGGKHRLRIDARIRTRDHHRLRALSPMGQRLIARPLGRPDVGAEAAIAFDQWIHGGRLAADKRICCTAIERGRAPRKEAECALDRRNFWVDAPNLGRHKRAALRPVGRRGMRAPALAPHAVLKRQGNRIVPSRQEHLNLSSPSRQGMTP